MVRSQPCKSQRGGACRGHCPRHCTRPWSGNESVLEEQKEPRVLGGSGLQRENHHRRAEGLLGVSKLEKGLDLSFGAMGSI